MTAPPEPSGPMRLVVDFGPIVVFFATFRLAGGDTLHRVLVSTGAFMAAAAIALVAAIIMFRRVTPMFLLSTILIGGFGAITLYLRDPRYIMMKPTAYYTLMAVVLLGGLWRRKPLLRWLFGPIFRGLDEPGWLKLSRNWAFFFVALAITNEILRRQLSFEVWQLVKVWGVTIVSFAFAAANIRMLLRHGLEPENKGKVAEQAPIE